MAPAKVALHPAIVGVQVDDEACPGCPKRQGEVLGDRVGMARVG